MLEQLQAQWDRFLEYWGNLEANQQYTFIGIIAVAGVIISLLMYWAMQPQWVTLYNQELAMEEVGELQSELENLNIPHRVSGTNIEVPLNQVDQVRMELANAGVTPRSTVGFEIFEEGGIGITNFERQVRYKRALEGSLARAIQSNPQISQAQVQIAMQREDPVFEEDEEPVRASVKVGLERYAQLDEEQVQGITNLVSYGVVGLEPENIRITDQDDRPLKNYNEDGQSPGEVQRIQVVDRIERKLNRKLMNSLSNVYPDDRLSTAVNIEMDFDQIEEHLTQYRQPEGAREQLREAERTESEEYVGQGSDPGGEAGVESNIPGSEAVDTDASQYQRQEDVVDYLADRNVTHIIRDPVVERMTAHVSVDGKRTQVWEDGNIEFEYEPPTEDEIEKIQDFAETAIGFDEERGDRIEVAHIQFDRSEELEQRREEIRQEAFQRRLAYFILGAIALTLLVIGVMFWLRKRSREKEEEEETEPEPEVTPEEDLMAEVSVEEERQQEIRDQIQDRAEENPEMVASVLRSWFSEEMS